MVYSEISAAINSINNPALNNIVLVEGTQSLYETSIDVILSIKRDKLPILPLRSSQMRLGKIVDTVLIITNSCFIWQDKLAKQAPNARILTIYNQATLKLFIDDNTEYDFIIIRNSDVKSANLFTQNSEYISLLNGDKINILTAVAEIVYGCTFPLIVIDQAMSQPENSILPHANLYLVLENKIICKAKKTVNSLPSISNLILRPIYQQFVEYYNSLLYYCQLPETVKPLIEKITIQSSNNNNFDKILFWLNYLDENHNSLIVNAVTADNSDGKIKLHSEVNPRNNDCVVCFEKAQSAFILCNVCGHFVCSKCAYLMSKKYFCPICTNNTNHSIVLINPIYYVFLKQTFDVIAVKFIFFNVIFGKYIQSPHIIYSSKTHIAAKPANKVVVFNKITAINEGLVNCFSCVRPVLFYSGSVRNKQCIYEEFISAKSAILIIPNDDFIANLCDIDNIYVIGKKQNINLTSRNIYFIQHFEY